MSDPYPLPPRLDLSAATPLAADLRGRLGGDLILDAGQVTQMGALCAQVIASAAISQSATGHAVRIINMSDRVVEQLHYLGFTPESLVLAEDAA